MASTRRGGGTTGAKEAKYQKLLKQAGGGLTKTPTRLAQPIVEYLANEEYFEPVTRILDPLDRSLIPVLPMTSGDEFGRTCINKANVAISNFPTFFEILLSAPPTPQTQSYHKHCMDLLFEGWSGVTEWIAFLLQMIPQLSSHAANGLLNSCCATIFTIVSHGKENAMAEELSCSPITCDMVYSFLQSMDISTTQYRILSPGGDTDACLIAKLYAHSFSSESGKRAMISSFRRRDRWGRRYIVRAVVGRIEYAARDAKSHVGSITDQAITIALYIQSLFAIATSNPRAYNGFCQEEAIPRCMKAVVTLAAKGQSARIRDQACWDNLVNATANLTAISLFKSRSPAKSLPSLIRAGILRSISMCMPYAERNPIPGNPIRPLLFVAPYLYLDKVVSAVMGSGGALDVTLCLSAYPPARDAQKGFQLELERSHAAHTSCLRPALQDMCSNPKHPVKHAGSEGGLRLKGCGRCRWVTYCSKKCQTEDWFGHHIHECSNTAAVVDAENLGRSKAIFELRRSQLTLLEHHLNQPESLSRFLQQIQLFQALDGTQPRHPPIPIVNFGGPTSIQEVPWASKTVSFKRVLPCYDVPLCKDDDAGHWELRYRSLTEDVDWDSKVGCTKPDRAEEAGVASPRVIAVEGHFWYSPELAMRTLVKARYKSRGVEEGGGWTIVGNISRIVTNREHWTPAC